MKALAKDIFFVLAFGLIGKRKGFATTCLSRKKLTSIRPFLSQLIFSMLIGSFMQLYQLCLMRQTLGLFSTPYEVCHYF